MLFLNTNLNIHSIKSMSNIRDSPNLIRNEYGRGRWENVIDYINEMQDKTIYIPPGPANIHSSKDYNLRIDLQGVFPDHSRPNVTWFNIQVQENRARGGVRLSSLPFYTFNMVSD